jgi:Xaa-Pro aminopeptidase
MAYLITKERDKRLAKLRKLMKQENLDVSLIYYDEFNIGNGWYLTGWCPQFESGAVLVPIQRDPMLLGGPESEPFAKMDSAITETRNFPVFMVPDEEYPNATIINFKQLFDELNSNHSKVRRIGIVGTERMPVGCHKQISEGFSDVTLVDITDKFTKLRYAKSDWELDQIREAFALADKSYEAMKSVIASGITEIEIAAEGEYVARKNGASGFGFSAIVGSGKRANAVVPTATNKKLITGEMVMLGLAPKKNGYAGVFGDTVPVSGKLSKSQKEMVKHLSEVYNLTKEQLIPGKTGREIDAPGREYYKKHGLMKYLVCPFAHTIGLQEAESPFWGPNSDDVLKPGMAVCVDVSFFGHPDWHGARIETGFEIDEKGAIPFVKKMDTHLSNLG